MKNISRPTKTLHFTPEIRDIFNILTNEEEGAIVHALIHDLDFNQKEKHLKIAWICIKAEEQRREKRVQTSRKGGLAKALNNKKCKCKTKKT